MSRIQPKTQRSIIAHKSTCAPSGSIPRTGYTKKHSSIPFNLFLDFGDLSFVIESLTALRRKPFYHRKRVFQIDDKLDLVMNGTEDLLFNLFCGDAVWAARPAVLIGGADVIDILFRLRRDGLADHWLLTVSAEQEAGKQVCFVLIGRTAHIPLHHDLDCHEVLVGHKSFMRIQGISIQERDLSSISSTRRNPVLADIFGRLGYMERQGSGFKKITETYHAAHNYRDELEPKFYSDASSFQVTLYNLNYGTAATANKVTIQKSRMFTAPLNSRTFLTAITKIPDKSPAAAFFAKAAAVVRMSILRIFRPSFRRSHRCRYSTRWNCRP